MSLFDKLQNELDIREKEGGISPLDLAELPVPLRKLMRTMLREIEMSRAEIAKLIENMDAEERKEIKGLDDALKILVQQGWLVVFGEGEGQRYRVNLRRRKGSTLAGSVFAKLEERMDARNKIAKEPPLEDEPK